MSKMNQSFYDVVLIQPPLLLGESEAHPIEKAYWHSMKKHCGQLLGDMPIEASWGVLSIASYLEQSGYRVRIIDFHLIDYLHRRKNASGIDSETIRSEIAGVRADFFGLSVLTIANDWSNLITNEIKSRHTEAMVFWGGYYPTYNSKEILSKNANIDFIARNEGEETLRHLLECHRRQPFSLRDIPGITYREGKKIIRNRDREEIQDLDTIPVPNYALYPFEQMEIVVPRVYATRGCKNSCLYCTANNFNGFRKRDPVKVVDEIADIQSKYGKNFFVLGDLEFLSDIEQSMAVCDEIIKRRIEIAWWCQTSPSNISRDVVERMSQAGNIQIALGIESSNGKGLSDVNKERKLAESIEACKIIKEFNIQIQAYIMLGLPDDTLSTSLDTIKLVGELLRSSLIDVTHISVMTPYPGSRIFKRNKSSKIRIIGDRPSYLMNCDLYGSGIPSYDTQNLSRYEIYSLWLLALSHALKQFPGNKAYKELFKPAYERLGLTKSS